MGLIVWGTVTLLSYLGVPVHQAVLLSDPAKQAVLDACGENGSLLCKGWNAAGTREEVRWCITNKNIVQVETEIIEGLRERLKTK